VQLARALSHPMRLLILDEPFAGLDAATRGHFHALLERLMDTTLRVLLITTRVEDLPRHITHLLCVGQCRVVAAGARGAMLALPKVRGFFSGGMGGTGGNGDASGEFLRRGARARGCGQESPRSGSVGRKGRLGAHGSDGVELVRLSKVTVRYGKTVILRDINWTIRAGESWALLGPNGSGKTTLLSLILGDNPQVYSNEVVVFGQRRGSGESVWEIKQQIGWVSPELHLHFNDSASCFEVVASGFHDTVGLFERVSSRQRATVRSWLARFRLLEVADRPLFSLSAGIQRMVLLARALVTSPRLLVLDEPCQGLDSEHRSLFVRAVDGLIRGGTATVAYVTHRQDEIPPSIHRVLRLHK
jgi:molybdate transport system ATP-binding protein